MQRFTFSLVNDTAERKLLTCTLRHNIWSRDFKEHIWEQKVNVARQAFMRVQSEREIQFAKEQKLRQLRFDNSVEEGRRLFDETGQLREGFSRSPRIKGEETQ